MKNRLASAVFISTAAFLLPAIGLADDDHHMPAPAKVDFGVLPIAPLGPPPCLQTGAIGGPTDPCAFKLHHLTPEETTIAEGAEVQFQVHGGGHGITIFQVSANTTRDALGKFLCAGPDPHTLTDPSKEPCNALLGIGATNANGPKVVFDGEGNKVIELVSNDSRFPNNRVWYEPGRFMSAGAQQFLNGGTTPAATTIGASDGQVITFRFHEKGRYLVMCMNRSHALNDWMFGFVNVVEGDKGEK
jgi:hypothetical protein